MRSSSSSTLGSLFGLLTLLVLACHTHSEPLVPLVDAPPRAAKPAPDAQPPLTLTATDGTGLTLSRLSARAVVDGPLALTQMELTFDNPRADTMEGRFEIRLPPGARVTRFAMEIGGHLMEAEVVEKQRARQTYETFLHQRRDPALLELDTGNRFRARVFPIALTSASACWCPTHRSCPIPTSPTA